MRISQEQVLAFAAWSGDRNPIHVDPEAARNTAFGSNIVHGALTTIELLRHIGATSFVKDGIQSLDIEFRGEIKPNHDYSIQVSSESGLVLASLNSTARPQITIRAELLSSPEAMMQMVDWATHLENDVVQTGPHEKPVAWTPAQFKAGRTTTGKHSFGSHAADPESMLTTTQEKVLGLCSFIIGMRTPGLASLFTRLKVNFYANPDIQHELVYQLTLRDYDPHFRILQTELDVATLDGQLIASIQLQSYVRFPFVEPDAAKFVHRLPQELEGKVALVCGASRGLGAEMAGVLGAAKCHVLIACRRPNEQTNHLVNNINKCGGTAEIVAGDVGDSNWCEATKTEIVRCHGRLDILILNACGPLSQIEISSSTPQQSAEYINENVALSMTPLISFLPLVSHSQGYLIAISSSAVEELPSGFGHYVAVKMALEGAIRTAARENSDVRFLIARPPKLQTSWNDTPSRAIGCIPPSTAALQIIEALFDKNKQEQLKVLSQFENVEVEQRPTEHLQDAELVLCSNFTIDSMQDGLRAWASALHLTIAADLAPYGQVLQQLLDPNSRVSRNPLGAVVLLRVRDWLREMPDVMLADPKAVGEWLKSTAAEHIQAFKAQRSFATGSTLLIICPSLAGVDTSFLTEIADAENALLRELAELPGLTAFHASSKHDIYQVPDSGIYDPLRDEIGHMPFSDGYYAFLSTLIVRQFYHKLTMPKKVIVMDCDNTLWDGVVGEVGPSGVNFGPAYLLLQQRLVQLSENGVLLCLCSKNEQQDVWDVFEQRSDFQIKREHIVIANINWHPKSENIRAIAEELNLGLDSFIFIDDNPVECAEVRTACPDVLTVQWPKSRAAATNLLNHFWELDVIAATAEDRKRTQLYKEEFHRQQTRRAASNFQQFIDSLKLNVEIAQLDLDSLPRASQLTMRTNQFNFTTIRRTESELKQLLADPRYLCRTVCVNDRFGDYGLVGLFIVEQQRQLQVDTFLLSCRVLGRGVEHRLAAEIGRIAQEHSLDRVQWKHIATAKNIPAKMFLSELAHGELTTDSAGVSCFDIDAKELTEFRYQATETYDLAGEVPQHSPRESAYAPRQREQQIEYTSDTLSSFEQLATLVSGEQDASIQKGNFEIGEIESCVIGAFAKAIRLSEREVAQIDRLDAMGCDSLRIVEITVALTKRFPWLPKTLLFEHGSVSDIVHRITELTSATSQVNPATDLKVVTARPISSESTDIAIVGLGVHCAGCKSASDLWDVLSRGESYVGEVPRTRPTFVGELIDERKHFAGLLDDADQFDPEFFGISPREAEYMDPQLRLLLQTAWHALEDAGSHADGFDVSTGIFVGVMYAEYAGYANAFARKNGGVYRCWEGFSLANRLSQVLGLKGPSLSIDTACSSSATALHYACQSLRSGDCTSAVVSGVNMIVDPVRLVQFGRLGILSTSGKCVPFGSGADGTVLGEGVVSVVLRPLKEAEQRGDRIYAVIKGTGLSSGAGSVGFTAPNPTAQAQAAQQAILAADIDPRTVSYIETHGTGTELGDPIEVRGLEIAYCDRRLWNPNLQITHKCAIGSIKPNVGHLEAGAGLMGMIKAALQLHHHALAPSLTSKTANPQIPFAELPFEIQQEFEPWKRVSAKYAGKTFEVLRRAGVNSFGVGGSNVHIILEEFAESPHKIETDRSAHLLSLSAATEHSLRILAADWQLYLNNCPPELLASACFSANVGRQHATYRAAVVLDSETDVSSSLTDLARGHAMPRSTMQLEREASTQIAFLFTGQGSQYPGMLKQLWIESPVFRKAFDACAEAMHGLISQPLQDLVFSGDTDDRQHALHDTGNTQPALFAIQYALFELWKSWGIVGNVLVGHSIGEVAAYCAAGGCSLPDAITLVAARGRLMQSLPLGGGMSSIAADAATVAATIKNVGANVSIAAMNGPEQTVISGAELEVEAVSRALRVDGVKIVPLAVSHAFHSALMEPMLEEFANVLKQLDFGRPQIPIVSSVTGEWVHDAMSLPEYWLMQARNPVNFIAAIKTLQANAITHFLEIGPHPVLLGMGRACIGESSAKWLPSARRGRPDWSVILDSLGKLYVDGVDIDWRSFDAPYARKRISIPGYHFDTRRIWIDGLDPVQQDQLELSPPTKTQPSHSEQTYELVWRDAATKPPGGKMSGTWLLIADTSTPVEMLCERLSELGVECVCLKADMAPTEASSEVYKSTRTLLEQRHFERILLIEGTAGGNALTQAAEIQKKAVSSVFAISRIVAAITDSGCTKPRSVWLITQRSVAIERSDSLDLATSPVWGFARVANLECWQFWGGVIDVENLDRQADSLIQEIAWPNDEDQVGFRNGKRLVPRLRLQVSTKMDQSVCDVRSICEKGAILVTGGLGSIGFRIAQWLVENGARRIILTSRSGVPSKVVSAGITSWRQRGVNVSVLAADIATSTGVDACLEAAGESNLVGVVHAAGLDLETPIKDNSLSGIQSLFAAKVAGAWLLHQACQSAKTELFICCSSIAAVWGSPNRSVYAAANAFLDALTHHRRQMNLPALSINFGPWSGGGMANEDALNTLAQLGNYGLSPDRTVELIGDLIRQGATQTVLVDIDWPRFRSIVEARRPIPLFSELGIAAQPISSTPVPTDLIAAGEWVTRLAALESSERLGQLSELLAEEVSGMLRLRNGSIVPYDRSLFELGMDSLTAAELTTRIRSRFGNLDCGFLLSDPTIHGIARRLLERVLKSGCGAMEPQSQSPSASKRWNGNPEMLERVLAEELAAALGVPGLASSPATRPFQELGVDSLSSVEFANRVRRRLSLHSPPRVLNFDNLQQLSAHIQQSLPKSDSNSIVGYDVELEKKIFEFCREGWPERRTDWIESRWKWMFLESARRIGVDPKVWLFVDGGQVVGHMGAQMIELKVGNQFYPTGWLVETMVFQSHRPKGVGTQLLMQAQDDFPFSLSLGQTEQVRAILKNLGWQRIAALQTFMLPLNPLRVLQGKVHPAVNPIASAWLRLRGTTKRYFSAGSLGRQSVAKIDRFGDRHTELWQKASVGYGCAAVRDASYLNWKYVDQPGQDFTRLEILSGEELIACVVLSLAEPDRNYSYRRANIVDIVTSTDRRHLHTAVDGTVKYCFEQRVDAVIMHLISSPIQQALEDYGFMQRSPTRHLVISLGENADRAKLLDPAQWLITLGDSDIDRPW